MNKISKIKLTANISNLTIVNSLPKFHRQQYLLALLELSGGTLSIMHLQKLLFLAEKVTNNEYYHFIPFHYGCYSFQAQADIESLELQGWLTIDGNSITIKNNIVQYLKQSFTRPIIFTIAKYNAYSTTEILLYIFEKYPYFSIKSKNNNRVLRDETDQSISQNEIYLIHQKSILFTLGYEGITLEQYINLLIKNNIKLLCDVRSNPISRKFGFSKKTLSNVLQQIDIEYIHFPELGVESKKRINLETKQDYARLFVSYRKSLSQKFLEVSKIMQLVERYGSIALTCFEKQHKECHRHCLSDFILQNSNSIKVVHL
ncbi:MAG TPA: DUF488 family protein [Nitrosomonas sp.]|nr:DUF488 family protein [Nitrosomonas sp.]HQX14677.1 DUF488 family protein [Nitrosomonas sp.]HRB33779.1 DUF488 family protein [Nitrosomonas sp.]HRB78407.1 DUF488 family protein [Nitrosomonas sp.]